MDCHREARGDHPDEPRVRGFAELGKEIPWVRVDRLPGRAYFPHGVHVSAAKIKCEDCHIGILEATTPLVWPDIRLSMEDCMRCHRERNASNACKSCHRER
jgi:hypothetical protein